MGQFNDISTIRSRPRGIRKAIFILPASQVIRLNVSKILSVFVQYFRLVLKNVDNEQVGKLAICDLFVCKGDSGPSFG